MPSMRVLTAWLAVLLSTLCAACGAADERPSVLVIVADSLAATHVSSLGYARPTTPRFDAFARDSVHFERTWSAAAWTLPSVASLFTSRLQEEHGARDDELVLRADLPTLAERFHDAGWATSAIVQTPVLASRTGVARGFERYTVLDFAPESFDRALGLARDAIEQGDGPRLVYLHVAPPHMPYQPPAPFRGRFSAGSDALAHVDGSIASARAIHRARLEPDHPDVQRLAALYDEHVAWADERLGRFVDSVRALPRAKSLVIVWTSDHGEAFMEHGQQGHNASAYDEMLRVPLAIRGPGLAPRRVEAPASLLDLAPTLLELCSLPPLEHARGLSLAATLRDGSTIPERTLFASSRHYSAHPERLRLAAIHGSSKLILAPAKGTEEFFDLATDPHERRPLPPDFPAAPALRRALAASPLLAPPLAPDPLDFDATPPDPEELRRRRRLRELGYVDDN